ncbi:MAG: hypothetical protein HY542_04115 [Deltaproteobacteria bacterium]|nr:hypothetical protein [Deltaproteobacteria bacterium]
MSGNFFVGDIDKATGETNTRFLEELMMKVARGGSSWSAFDAYRKYGFVLPHHAAFLVRPYLSVFAEYPK